MGDASGGIQGFEPEGQETGSEQVGRNERRREELTDDQDRRTEIQG